MKKVFHYRINISCVCVYMCVYIYIHLYIYTITKKLFFLPFGEQSDPDATYANGVTYSETIKHFDKRPNIFTSLIFHIFLISLKFKDSPGFQFSRLSMRHCKLPVIKISSISRTR